MYRMCRYSCSVSSCSSASYSVSQVSASYLECAVYDVPPHIAKTPSAVSSIDSLIGKDFYFTQPTETVPAYASEDYHPAYRIVNIAPEQFLSGIHSDIYISHNTDLLPVFNEIFNKTTGKDIPSDVVFKVMDKESFDSLQISLSGIAKPGVKGLSVNSEERKEIFLRQGPLESVVVVAGHELGHVITPPLSKDVAEEAKAFAFTITWLKTIISDNTENLASAVKIPDPARNGLHDKALAFVLEKLEQGVDPMEMFHAIVEYSFTVVAS